MLFDKKIKKDKKKWGEDKAADVICQAVLHQNLCDYEQNPILIVDKATIKFLKRKYRILTSYTIIYIISWASGYGLIKPHPMTPPILTPENAHEPDVYYIAPGNTYICDLCNGLISSIISEKGEKKSENSSLCRSQQPC